MSSREFTSLQKLHEGLLQRQANLSDEDIQGFSEDVKEYIAEAKKVGAKISLIEEREQLRANLRYWASYIYGIDQILPDTDLAPLSPSKSFPVISFGLFVFIVGFALLVGLSIGGLITWPVAGMTSTTTLTSSGTSSVTNTRANS